MAAQEYETEEQIVEMLEDGYEDVGSVMSNFDHIICQKLEVGQYGQYPAWNFYGQVWRDENGYHCMVMRHRAMVDVVHGDSLKEIMEKTSDKWGWD